MSAIKDGCFPNLEKINLRGARLSDGMESFDAIVKRMGVADFCKRRRLELQVEVMEKYDMERLFQLSVR